MNYARYGATIHSISILHPQSPSTSNLVLGGGESAVETLNIWGGWREQPNARLPNDGLQDACSVVVSSPTSPYSSYIHLLGGQDLETSLGTNTHYRLKIIDGFSEG